MKLIESISSTVQALKTSQERNNIGWMGKWKNRLVELEKELPSGCGFDLGTSIVINDCKSNKIVLHTSYHHKNDIGYYDGWTYHDIIVTPSFYDIELRITGKDKNNIKDYIHDTFYSSLTKNNE